MKKLISMTDFVLQNYEKNDNYQNIADECMLYANFLKEPLTLGMFVPCDDDGNVLEEPLPIHTYLLEPEDYEYDDNEVLRYKEAQPKVIFKGISLLDNWIIQKDDEFLMISKDEIKNMTIEDLVPYNLEMV